jgi:hypothetical protein
VALTPNLSTVTVGGQYVDVAGNPIAGQVKFTPRAILVDTSGDQVIVNRTITVDLDANGEFAVVLPVTDDTDISPVNFTYRVEEAFSGGRVYDITLPSAPSTQNLADKVPAAPAGGSEEDTYVLLSVFAALEVRVDTIETVTSVVQGIADEVTDAVAAAEAAEDAALAAADSAADAAATILHPFLTLGI